MGEKLLPITGKLLPTAEMAETGKGQERAYKPQGQEGSFLFQAGSAQPLLAHSLAAQAFSRRGIFVRASLPGHFRS
jgi:hypothetical protein